MIRFAFLFVCLALAACGGSSGDGGGETFDRGVPASVECAPFARALTGMALSGDAADWWPRARGRYARSAQPDVGSVMVFGRQERLPHGHVSVVSRILSRREIMVTQANWVHHVVTQDQPVVDVSANGDWSLVRVWWPPSGQMGTHDYQVSGFIRPDYPVGHDRLVAATPAAIRVAGSGR